jgi:hypothetical protein
LFLSEGGELHTRVLKEMRAVLADDAEPSWLNEGENYCCARPELSRGIQGLRGMMSGFCQIASNGFRGCGAGE